MGIPRLTTYLSPYAVPTILGCESQRCPNHPRGSNTKIIIDGPSFAFEVYDRLITNKPSVLDVLGAIPSYHEIGKAVLSFLEELEGCGLIIDKIYFDGFLPPDKIETRISRLNQLVNKLSSLHVLHKNGFQMSSPADVEAEYEPSQHPTSKSTQSNLHSLPPPPFLVPTIIETLRHSKYAHLTSVIPGEADTYCAQAAQQTGGTILSNDSDLWIYDLGPNGAVGSLHQLRIIAAENGTEFDPPKPHRAVQTTILKPQDAARSLNLPNLLPLAYVLKTQQPHSFHSALSHAKTLTLTPSQTATHLAEYTTPPSTFSSLHHHPSTLSHLHTNPYLDPRLSELLLQPPTAPPTIYLPLPLENPTLTTSFAPSLTTRKLAYSCCALPHGLQNKCVYEYSRKGLKSLPVSVSILCLPQIVTHASTLLTRLRTHKRIFAAYPPFLQWRLYALAEIYQWYIETGRSPPQRADMVAALFGRVEGGWMGWGGVHLVAQVEASLYSVRMVGQVLILVVESGEVGMEVRGTLEGLMGELEDLPGLAELMMRRGELRERCRDMDVEEVLDLLAGVLWDEIGRSSDYELEEREEEDSKRGEGIAVKGRRKRKRRKKARNTG